jgi:hypothetical protein
VAGARGFSKGRERRSTPSRCFRWPYLAHVEGVAYSIAVQMTFRWFGPTDPIPLSYIRQISSVRGVVSALLDASTEYQQLLRDRRETAECRNNRR